MTFAMSEELFERFLCDSVSCRRIEHEVGGVWVCYQDRMCSLREVTSVDRDILKIGFITDCLSLVRRCT